MVRIHHVQYMPKKYGGSETLISLIAMNSKHSHTIKYAQNCAAQTESRKFYEQIVADFAAFFDAGRIPNGTAVHAHFIFSGIPAQKHGIRTICSSHCLFSEEFKLAALDATTDVEKRELLEAYAYFDTLERELYPQAKNLIVHSEFHRQEVERKGGKPRVIELPVAVSDFELGMTKKEARAALGLKDKFTILFLGRPTYLKGFSVLADAFNRLPNKDGYQLLIVGDFDLNGDTLTYRPCVKVDGTPETAASIFVGDHVRVFPPTQHEQIPICFTAADVLVCPSFYEAIGYVNLEAMAAGTAVIGSNVAGIPYVVKDQQTGLLFRTGDSQDLADKIELLFHNKELRTRIVENGKDFVRQFDVCNICPKYDALYDSIVEGNK